VYGISECFKRDDVNDTQAEQRTSSLSEGSIYDRGKPCGGSSHAMLCTDYAHPAGSMTCIPSGSYTGG
jgi:hypothetical protein